MKMQVKKEKIEFETHTKQLTDKAVEQKGKVAYQTFNQEDIELSNEYLIPFHAIEYAELKREVEDVEIEDDTCNSDTEPTPKPDAPTISGIDDITIAEGDTFDPMDGVSAVDSEGNPIEVTVSGEVDTETPGTYTLTYTATDSEGRTTTVTRTVIVSEKSTPIINGANDVTINQGVGINLKDGVTATLDGEDIDFTVNPETIEKCEVGEHDVTYTATGNGKTTTVTRKVTIEQIDNPVISGADEPITVDVGEEFDPLEGVTAKDGNGNDVTVEIVQPETKAIVEGGSANYTGNVPAVNVPLTWYGEFEKNASYKIKFFDLIVNGENKGDEFETEITLDGLYLDYDFGELRFMWIYNQAPVANISVRAEIEGLYPISFSAFVITTI